MTAEVPIGFVVFQEKFISQLLFPESITQEVLAGVRVPVGGAHLLPSQVVPEIQLAVRVLVARIEPLREPG